MLQEQAKKTQEPAPKVEAQVESKPKNPTIGGVQLSPEQWENLKNGNYIYLENMNRSDDKGKFSSYVFLNEEKVKAFFSKENPDEFVKYGTYEMRIRDKILIEEGFVIKAKVKWWGGGFAHPCLWKEKSTDPEYKESWGDPRKKQEEKLEKKETPTTQLENPRGRKL